MPEAGGTLKKLTMQTTFKLKMNAPYLYVRLTFITGRNEVVAKVMFYRCVSVHRGGGGRVSASVHAGMPDPPDQTDPPRIRQTPPPTRQTPRISQTPPRTRQTPPPDQADPPQGSRLQHTVYERPVRIILECILVRCAMTIPNSPEKPLII